MSQTNILRRYLHRRLKKSDSSKRVITRLDARNTFLRNHTNPTCPESLINFWLGWDGKGMSELYDGIKKDVPFRMDVVNSCGVGFDVQLR